MLIFGGFGLGGFIGFVIMGFLGFGLGFCFFFGLGGLGLGVGGFGVLLKCYGFCFRVNLCVLVWSSCVCSLRILMLSLLLRIVCELFCSY